MELSLKKKVVIVLGYTVVCIAAGRYLGPEKVRIEKEQIKTEVSKKVEDKQSDTQENRDKHKVKTRVQKVLPDGTKETTTTITEDDTTSKSSKIDEKTKEIDAKKDISKESKTVDRSGSKTTISALAGINASNLNDGFVYGASVTKEILGPITGGAWALTNGTCGVSAGVTF